MSWQQVCFDYDGSYPGFLTCVFESYAHREEAVCFTSPEEDRLTLWPERHVDTDQAKAERVYRSLSKKISPQACRLVTQAFLTCLPERELHMYRFLRLGYQRGADITRDLTDDRVHVLWKAVQHLGSEAHLLKGFLRFSDQQGVLVGEIEPKNRVLPLLRPHFCTRYSGEHFLIYDRTHRELLLYTRGQRRIVPVESLTLELPGPEELQYRALWQEFFRTTVEKDPQRNERLIRWVIACQKVHISLAHNTNYAFTALVYQMLQFPLFARSIDIELSANKNDLRPAYNIGILTTLLSKFEYLYNITVLSAKNIDKILYRLFNDYLRFVIDGGLGEFEDFDETVPSGCVSFMTIHQSKGLEFPITIVGSMNGVPRKNYSELGEILQREYFQKPMYEPIEQTKYYDFARLYYTAFSRAQNLLVLTGREHTGAGSLPSKPFRTIWDQTPSWKDTSKFDLNRLTLADVKPVNIKHEYSFTSHILFYESCPLQYKFYKELEFAEVRTGGPLGGSLLHQTIEDIHRAVLRNEVNRLTDENITEWFNLNYQLLVKQMRSFLREEQQQAILKQILRYRDNNADKWHLIQEAEVDVSLVKDDYILKGTIDLVKGEDDTVELVDFKSGDKPDVNTRDEKKRQQLNQYRRQLEVYAHLIEQRTGAKVSKMHLYYPKEDDSNPRITFPYRAHNIEETIDSFEQVVRKIERRDFSMEGIRRTENQCKECDMRFYCNNKHC